jgi:hypothetical protein
MTYTVEMQEPDGQWSTIAVGLTSPSLALSAEQGNASTLRITATNGFLSSPPITVNLCSTQINHAAELESALNDLQTRKAPKAQLDKARADLSTATTQLTTCQTPK